MFERQERMAIFLLVGVTVAVIASHFILADLGKQPFARPYSIDAADGELVVVEGDIDRITLSRSGGHMILDVDNLSVFLPGQVVQEISLQKGERISVYGIVQTYRGKKEIIVSAADDVRILPPQP